MVPELIWITLTLFVSTTVSSTGDDKVFIELTELEYEDACYATAEAEWAFINSPLNQSLLSKWRDQELAFSAVKKGEIGNITREVLKDPSLQYKCDVIRKPGDALLEEEDWNKLISFIGACKQLRTSATYTKKTGKLLRKDVENLLSHTGKADDKRSVWSGWHLQLDPLISNFSSTLPLIKKAAEVNDVKDVYQYWEMLSGLPNGYDKIRAQWSSIDRLHNKIINFARSYLSHNYNIHVNDSLPAYLLGSLQGYDWTAMSIDMMPYTNMTYGIRKNLWKKKLIGKSLYQTASRMGTIILNQTPQAEFWEKSLFNKQCPANLINFCKDGNMRLSTCFEATISNYLAAHKNVGKVLYNQMTVESTPVLNIANRYSGLEESISELFGILSASPGWLNHVHLLKATDNNEERSIVSLMITALDVIPRLAYYMSADMWRLNVVENGTIEPAELVSTWWKYRQQYEKVTSDSMNEPTFLNDDYIISNKPYLPKFIGVLLSFQLYEYMMESTEVRYDRIEGKQVDAALIRMMQQGGADDWMTTLNNCLEIDDISADSLLSFFTPLEDFLDEMQEEFDYKTGTAEQKDFEMLEKEVIHEINNPTTTPVPTTKKRLIDVKPSSMPKDEGKNGIISKSGTRLQPDSSIQADKPGDSVTTTVKNLAVPSESSVTPQAETEFDEENKKPKIDTSKAVWAVGAVLVALVVICVIAIFGRRRCRKTPKNRRYV